MKDFHSGKTAHTTYVNCKIEPVEDVAGTDHCRRGTGRKEFALEVQQSTKYFIEQVGLKKTYSNF